MPGGTRGRPSTTECTYLPTYLYHLLWFYFFTDSEFRCLAMRAKPYPVSGPTPLPQIPNQLHFIQKSAMKCLVLSWRPESCRFSHEIINFVFKQLELCI